MKRTFLAVLLALTVSAGFGATFKLKDGTTVTGKVVSSNASKLIIEDERGNMTVLSHSDLSVPTEVPVLTGGNSLSNQTTMGTNMKPKDEYRYVILGLNVHSGVIRLSDDYYWNYYGASLSFDLAFLPCLTFGSSFSLMLKPLFYSLLYDYFIEFDVAYHPFTTQGVDLLKAFRLNGPRDRFVPWLYIGIDPYIGLGAICEISEPPQWDVPLTIGLNFWLLRGLGIRLQNKLYMLSISDNLKDDISIGIVISF